MRLGLRADVRGRRVPLLTFLALVVASFVTLSNARRKLFKYLEYRPLLRLFRLILEPNQTICWLSPPKGNDRPRSFFSSHTPPHRKPQAPAMLARRVPQLTRLAPSCARLSSSTTVRPPPIPPSSSR